jgi:hypothetical protein
MAVRSLGFPAQAAAQAARFTDVHPAEWHYAEVNKADAAGLLDWVAGSLFEPDRVITRAEMAQVIYACRGYVPEGGGGAAEGDAGGAGASGAAAATAFPDLAGLAEGPRAAMEYCIGEGIIVGFPSSEPGTYLAQPDGNATRAQAAAILLRALRAQGLIDP